MATNVEGIGEDPLRDMDSGNDSDSDYKEYLEQIMSDPLALVEDDSNLEHVLNSKTIGEAIQILCPKIPGLPTKARGKYQKRRLLTEEQKLEVLRATNRENARLTRKRKKIYNDVITGLLSTLHQVLGDDIVKKCIDVQCAGPQASSNFIRNINTSTGESSRGAGDSSAVKRRRGRPRKIEVIEDVPSNDSEDLDRKIETIQRYLNLKCDRDIPCTIFSDLRLEYTLQGFVHPCADELNPNSSQNANSINTHASSTLNTSNTTHTTTASTTENPRESDGDDSASLWCSLCHPDMVHSMPVPIFRTMSPLAVMDHGRYQCQGPAADLDDCSRQHAFFQWVVQSVSTSSGSSVSDDLPWYLEAEVLEPSICWDSTGSKVSLDYRLVVWTEGNANTSALADPNTLSLLRSRGGFGTTDVDKLGDSLTSCSSKSRNDANDGNVKLSTTSSDIATNVTTSSSVSSDDDPKSPSTQSPSKPSPLTSQRTVYLRVLEQTISAIVSFSPDGRISNFHEEFDVLLMVLMKERIVESATDDSKEDANANNQGPIWD